LQPFDYIVPKDFADASALLADGERTARALQGGTDLIIRARGGFVRPQCVVDLKPLPGMRELRPTLDGGLVIGAACTMNQVACHPLVQRDYDLLAQACVSVASYQLRNRATLGGNCCNASPAADTVPALYCLETVAQIYGPDGERCVPIDEFFAGPGRNALGRGEFLTALILPPSPSGARGVFNKLGRTKLGDIAIVTVAAYRAVVPMGGRRWRIALGAVGPTPLRAGRSEAALNADESPEGIRAAAELAAAAARPISDIRASAGYRSAMVRVLTRRAVETVLADVLAGEGTGAAL
jgi:CO/xanthine dehydrogenase FAD-binding subunit